jgi:hypothetical protein
VQFSHNGFQWVWGDQKTVSSRGKQDWTEMVQMELVLECGFGLVEPVGFCSNDTISNTRTGTSLQGVIFFAALTMHNH